MHIIYVDDEKPAIDNFRFTVMNFSDIDTLNTFQNGEEALAFAGSHAVDVAFLDMEMPGVHGLELAQRLKKLNCDIRVIFVTAFSQYALDAWKVDATGYLLKPYSGADIRKELNKCIYKVLPSNRVVIQTIPSFGIVVNGTPLYIAGAKLREMLALLVDRGERGLTMGEAIACLWPERAADPKTQSLYRMTWKRLTEALEAAGIGDILTTSENRRYLRMDQVDCDLYRILAGDQQARKKYCGSYLAEYAWAEERNAQLYWLLVEKRDNDPA